MALGCRFGSAVSPSSKSSALTATVIFSFSSTSITGSPSILIADTRDLDLLCHPRSRRFEGCSHTVKFFQTPRQGHPSGNRRTPNFRRERLDGIYHDALEPNMPPSNFFGLRHGAS